MSISLNFFAIFTFLILAPIVYCYHLAMKEIFRLRKKILQKSKFNFLDTVTLNTDDAKNKYYVITKNVNSKGEIVYRIHNKKENKTLCVQETDIDLLGGDKQ